MMIQVSNGDRGSASGVPHRELMDIPWMIDLPKNSHVHGLHLAVVSKISVVVPSVFYRELQAAAGKTSLPISSRTYLSHRVIFATTFHDDDVLYAFP